MFMKCNDLVGYWIAASANAVLSPNNTVAVFPQGSLMLKRHVLERIPRAKELHAECDRAQDLILSIYLLSSKDFDYLGKARTKTLSGLISCPISSLSQEEKLSNMIGEASSSGHSRFNASNALSHVYIQYPPLRCHIPGSRSLFYDDGNKLILSLTSNEVVSWKIVPYNPYVTPSTDPISEGPVLSIRYSLDLKLLAIQRSSHEVQIWNKETGDTFSHKIRSESESILGFFWSDCPTCDIVLVKTSGVEFYACNTSSKSLQLVETKKLNINWYIYTHESRLVLFASGMQSRSFTGYQLSSAGTVRLPRFEMVMAESEANDKPILAAEDVHIIIVYGRIYCVHFDRVAMMLHLNRFYRDTVLQQGSLPVYSSRIAVSVVDNVLLVHQVDSKVVILYDLFADSQAPISAPLPLLFRGFTRANIAVPLAASGASGASDFKNLGDTELKIYGDQWNFLVPDIVCDFTDGFLWKICLDLEAISASSSEVPLVLEFLQRRKLEAEKAKQLCLTIVRTAILERKPVPLIAKAIDVLLAAYSHAIKTGSYYQRGKADEYSSSNASNPSRPSAVGNASISGTDTLSTKQEPGSGTGKESLPTPDSGGDLITNSYGLDALITRQENKNLLELDASKSEVPSAGQPQVLQPGSDQLASNASEKPQSLPTTSAAASTSDLYTFVFRPAEEEMAGDGSYLTSILVEFLRSASLEKLKIQTSTYVLMVQILARDEHYAELGLFITNRIIEPSKEVALQLLESGRQNLLIRKLGLAMLRQLSLHHDYVLLLVQDGYYLEALMHVNTVRPSFFLESAHTAENPQHLSAVLRFFSDFVPGFNTTVDHHTYHRIVAEMNS